MPQSSDSHSHSGRIRFVYFDLGNVLVSFDRELVCRNLAGLFSGDERFVDEMLHVGGLQNDLESGRVSESQFAEIIRTKMSTAMCGELGETPPLVDDASILRAISDMFTPIESMRAVLASVRDAGFPIGILSNTCNAHWSWVNSQSYGVLEGPFDVCVVSHEVKSMKPDRLIYETAESHAKEIAGASPEQILFLDDREENVLAARQYGWNAEVCLGGQAAHDVLVRHGVLTVDSKWDAKSDAVAAAETVFPS